MKKELPKTRVTITVTRDLQRKLEDERWRRRARSLSALVEELLWRALDGAGGEGKEGQ